MRLRRLATLFLLAAIIGATPQAPAAVTGAAPQAPAATTGATPQAPAAVTGATPQAPAATTGATPQAPAAVTGAAPQAPAATTVAAPQAPAAATVAMPQAPAVATVATPQAPAAATAASPQNTAATTVARPRRLAAATAASPKNTSATIAATPQDDRKADRDAIRAHIDSIFQAFIDKDTAKLRATHHQNWLGYLEGSRTMIRGVDEYMNNNYVDPKSPYGMKSYSMREFDMIFKGDAAFVCFVADVEANTPNGPSKRTLRISDFYTKQDGKWIQTGSDTELHPESADAQFQTLRPLGDRMKKRLLDAREAVWRAYFSNDRAVLEKLIPEETVTIEAGDNNWGNRNAILEGAARFAKSGGKLVKLEFPKTEIQVYGFTAVVYSNYLYELEVGGQHSQQTGRVTEVFVLRNGEWVNPGWHMDTGK